jgi:hypothetical protein
MDCAYFFGALVHDGDLEVATFAELQAHLEREVDGDASLREGVARADGAQLAVIIRGSLTVRDELCVGELPRFSFCLGVHGDLVCQGLDIGAYQHAVVVGSLDTPMVRIYGSDGAMLHCGGAAKVQLYVHDQDQYPIAFEQPPVEIKTYDERLKALKKPNYMHAWVEDVVAAVKRGDFAPQ